MTQDALIKLVPLYGPGRGVPRGLALVYATVAWLMCLLLGCPATLAAAKGPTTLEHVTLQLKWTHAFQFAGYYAALEKGYYREAGLDVSIVEATPGVDPIRNVLEGKAQYGVGTSSLLLERSAGKPVVALAVIFQHSPYVLIARHETPTQGIHDLVGKRIMLEPQSDEIVAYLKAEGLSLQQFDRVEHSYDVKDLIEGRVDAIAGYVTNQPYYLRGAEVRYQIYTPRSGGIDFYGDNLFTTDQELQRHPARAKAFRAASLRGWQYAMEHPEELADLISARYSQLHSRNYFLFEARQMAPLMRPELIEIGYMYPGRWRHIAQVYGDLGMMKRDFDLKGFLYDPNPPPPDLGWLYLVAGATALGVAVVVAVALYIHRINVRLRQRVLERRQMEGELRESERKYRTLFEGMKEGFALHEVLCDESGRPVDYRFLAINPAFERMTGLSASAVLGRSVLEVLPATERLWVERYGQVATTGQADHFEEYSRAMDRTYRIQAFCPQAGQFAVVFEDITEERRAANALRAAKEAAEAATQVKEQFLAKLSHELRTPLTPVLLVTSLWQGQEDLPAVLRQDLAMVCRNLELEARLLDDLLDVNRIRHGKLSLRRELVHVHQMVHEAMAIVAASALAKRLRIVAQLDAPDDGIEGDPARVQQVIWNLLSNAIKFTPEAGEITVRTMNVPAGEIRIHVSDTGIGIEPELLGRLFEPFEQGGPQINHRYGGLGMGLTICKSMAEAHGGSITAISAGRGKGAMFTVQLPLTSAHGREKPLLASPALALAAGDAKLRVLLVEDHADTARMLGQLLRAKGYAVEAAGDVASALSSLQRSQFDLLISDLGLPDGSGHDLLRQARASGKAIRAIAVSGYGTEDDLRISREVGFCGHLVKPVKPAQLLEAIERLTGDASP